MRTLAEQKKCAVIGEGPPTDWPKNWKFPSPPWPPGWPLDFVGENITQEVVDWKHDGDTYIRYRSQDAWYEATDALDGHFVECLAFQDGRRIRLADFGSDYFSQALLVKIESDDKGRWGFTIPLKFSESGNIKLTFSIYGMLNGPEGMLRLRV